MLKRLFRIGRGFVVPYNVDPSPDTVALLNSERTVEHCKNCRFRSTMVDRCMRIEGSYYKTPVGDDHVCDLFENKYEKAESDAEQQQRLMLIKPRGGLEPRGLMARRIEIMELVARPNLRSESAGCKNCFYDPSGVGYAGCCYPGEIHDLNPIDGGKFCGSWSQPNSK